MKKYLSAIVDAFTDKPFSGNAAGVVVLGQDPFPQDDICIKIAAEFKHSETAFIRRLSDDEFAVRFFTPVCEASLCGHATVAAFTFMRERKLISTGLKLVHTKAGDIRIAVNKENVWLEMAKTVTKHTLLEDEKRELYSAFSLPYRANVNGLVPKSVSVGLTDIIMPVGDLGELNSAVQDEERIVELSRRLGITGVHMFCLTENDGYTAHCRNFAPLYGIPEECATGTSNGALLHYLSEYGVCKAACFIQGESMGRPSVIFAKKNGSVALVGGNAAVLMYGSICIPD